MRKENCYFNIHRLNSIRTCGRRNEQSEKVKCLIFQVRQVEFFRVFHQTKIHQKMLKFSEIIFIKK